MTYRDAVVKEFIDLCKSRKVTLRVDDTELEQMWDPTEPRDIKDGAYLYVTATVLRDGQPVGDPIGLTYRCQRISADFHRYVCEVEGDAGVLSPEPAIAEVLIRLGWEFGSDDLEDITDSDCATYLFEPVRKFFPAECEIYDD